MTRIFLLASFLPHFGASWAPRKARRSSPPSALVDEADRRLIWGSSRAHEERNPAFEDGNEASSAAASSYDGMPRLSLGGPGRPVRRRAAEDVAMVFSASSRRRSCHAPPTGERRAAGRSSSPATRDHGGRHFRHASSRVQPVQGDRPTPPPAARSRPHQRCEEKTRSSASREAPRSRSCRASGASRVDLAVSETSRVARTAEISRARGPSRVKRAGSDVLSERSTTSARAEGRFGPADAAIFPFSMNDDAVGDGRPLGGVYGGALRTRPRRAGGSRSWRIHFRE